MTHPFDPAAPDVLNWGGTLYRTMLTTEATAGAMSVTEGLSPVNSGPPRHIHHDADETFLIQEGRHTFWMEGETFERGPGDAVFVPRGREHTFRIIGDVPGRHMVILTPGGFEGFFAEMARGGFRIPEDMPAINAAAARFHLEFTGPPLGAP